MASSPHRKNGFSSSSSSIRFLRILEQPNSDPNPNPSSLELDESDVLWSSSDLSYFPSPVDSVAPNSPLSSASTDGSSPSYPPSGNRHSSHRRRRPFTPEKSGLSAALAEEPGPLLQQRKPSLDPSLSAASATRALSPVPKSRWEDLSAGSGKLFQQSAPVNVPVWPRERLGRRGTELDKMEPEEEEEEEEEVGEMLPPHVIVERSLGTTFSVFEGIGRTLKGRDLRLVRNAVFRKTGFLD